MEGIKDMAFCSEIVLQIKIARRANERLEVCKNNFDNIELWCSIQTILVASANISKILNPSEKKYIERGERLRNMLNVQSDFKILERKFRNSFFEHYDSRIDDWYEKNSNGKYIDLAINPSLNGRNLNTHRGYNSFNNTIEFRGDIFKIDTILKEMDIIYEKCNFFTLT
ncbi:hypothetical protein [Empedobacter tilapiae]|uniref:hypothetical protein n=1 Tax=Empedobacter tilapiae TaxID=2491114 RepID=UPI0028D4FE65|nr:hypothetical protein [Empedobacter tilapiae]